MEKENVIVGVPGTMLEHSPSTCQVKCGHEDEELPYKRGFSFVILHVKLNELCLGGINLGSLYVYASKAAFYSL